MDIKKKKKHLSEQINNCNYATKNFKLTKFLNT